MSTTMPRSTKAERAKSRVSSTWASRSSSLGSASVQHHFREDHILAAVGEDLARLVGEVLAAAVARGLERGAQRPAALLQPLAPAVAGAPHGRAALGAAEDRELAEVDRHQSATLTEGGSSRWLALLAR